MTTWKVYKFVKTNGKCPFDKWFNSKALTKKDRAKFLAKVIEFERFENLPPEKVKNYKGRTVQEFKVKGDRKQLRPLCIKDTGKKIILLCGGIEKDGEIPSGDLDRAERLLKEYNDGKCKEPNPYFPED